MFQMTLEVRRPLGHGKTISHERVEGGTLEGLGIELLYVCLEKYSFLSPLLVFSLGPLLLMGR